MPPTHMSSTSRALYRVFIAPNIRSTISIPLLYVPAFAPSAANSVSTPPLTSRTSIRTKVYAKDTRRHALSDSYTIDSAINAHLINLVDEEGSFHREVPLHKALSSFNKVTHHLIQVSAGKVDEFGNPDPEDVPTCRVISKMDLRAQHERKLESMRRQSKSQSSVKKMMELNWAIAGGDLKHRLGNLKRFLNEGKKVEVWLGPKKRGKLATPEEAEGLIKALLDAVAECKGAREKKREGQVGGVMTIVFEGQKVEKKAEKEGQKTEKEGQKTEKEGQNTEKEGEKANGEAAEARAGNT
ncbi:hypothetical protein BDW02DRAFT_567921 [Decorospora gaudefroyi]|uniref:Translation initiation factor 3 N-terminal domain-containing protein n=1 Tax=Decorospora gaudefroyi TaxID=184978 RepID=A0A6A5KML6_9PLEO|nr:hypothetical protein BDW02DRAFT_567921 [Decorospora gaudefroyi]